MRRSALVSGLVALTLLLTGTVATAKQPAGSATTCPPRYTPMTLSDILDQAQRLGIPEAAARNLFSTVNKNSDSWICQRKLPGDDTDINFLDNQAVGLDRRG